MGVSPAKDAADDLRRLLTTAGLVLAVFSVGAATQSVFVYGAPLVYGSILEGVPAFLLRTVVNLLACAVVLVLCSWLRLPLLRPVRQVLAAAAIAVAVAIGRFGVQNLVGIYVRPSLETAVVEVSSAAAVVAVALALGMAQMLSQARLRTQERALAEQRMRATAALAALSEEELRVRRAVADGLHGGLQARLVMVRVQLDRVIARWHEDALGESELRVLETVRAELDALREEEVRQLSHLLYPAGVDIGVAYALRQLVRRVPSQIEIEAQIDAVFDEEADAGAADEGVVAWRVALLRAAEEGISNALRHGGAGRIRIGLHARGEGDHDRVVLVVDDDGSGMPESGSPRRGLARSEERLRSVGGRQRLDSSPWGGVRLVVELPLRPRQAARLGSGT